MRTQSLMRKYQAQPGQTTLGLASESKPVGPLPLAEQSGFQRQQQSPNGDLNL